MRWTFCTHAGAAIRRPLRLCKGPGGFLVASLACVMNFAAHGVLAAADHDGLAPVPPALELSDSLYARLKPLVAVLNDLRPAAVEAARRECAQLGLAHKEELWAGLQDRDPAKRRLAIRMLPFLGEDARVAAAVASLLAGSQRDADPAIRLAAAMVLFNLPDPAAFDAACTTIATDADPAVRATVAQALGRFNDDRAVDPLLGALTDKSSPVRSHAASGLAHLNRQPVRVLAHLQSALAVETDLATQARLERAIARLRQQQVVSALAPADDLARPTPRTTPLDVLDQLANDMGAIEGRLRNDQLARAPRPDVVTDQQKVVDHLEELIQRLAENPPPSPAGKINRPHRREPDQESVVKNKAFDQPRNGPSSVRANPGSPTARTGSPAGESRLTPDRTRYGAQTDSAGSARADFSGLQEKQRNALRNLHREQLPEQWLGVLESYWLSVNRLEAGESAADETK